MHRRVADVRFGTGNEKIQTGFSLGLEEELNIFASYFAKSFSKDAGSGFSAREREYDWKNSHPRQNQGRHFRRYLR